MKTLFSFLQMPIIRIPNKDKGFFLFEKWYFLLCLEVALFSKALDKVYSKQLKIATFQNWKKTQIVFFTFSHLVCRNIVRP